MTNSNFENGLNLAPTQISSGHEGNLREQFSGYLARLKNGEMGALPAVAALLVLTALFSTLSPFFLTKLNFANLFLQAAQLTTLAVALVFVILLAEIDLSAGVAAGVAMDIFYLATFAGVNWIPALGMSLVFGATVGLVLGLFVAKVGVPSFVITLAFYLALQGVALILLGDGGLFRVDVPEVKSIMNENLPILGGWLLLLVVLGIMLGMGLYDRARRTRKGLVNKPLSLLLIKVGFMAVIGAGVVYVLNLDRSASVKPIYGVPIVIPIVLAIIFIGTFVLDRTTFGRHLYAVGGNPEAARRAGIKVSRIRISAFVITSVLAVIAGLFHVSRIGVVEAAAGRTISAGISFLVTGSVLALAATIDAVSRKRGGNLRV